jgi:hypothetical protein
MPTQVSKLQVLKLLDASSSFKVSNSRDHDVLQSSTDDSVISLHSCAHGLTSASLIISHCSFE